MNRPRHIDVTPSTKSKLVQDIFKQISKQEIRKAILFTVRSIINIFITVSFLIFLINSIKNNMENTSFLPILFFIIMPPLHSIAYDFARKETEMNIANNYACLGILQQMDYGVVEITEERNGKYIFEILSLADDEDEYEECKDDDHE